MIYALEIVDRYFLLKKGFSKSEEVKSCIEEMELKMLHRTANDNQKFSAYLFLFFFIIAMQIG